MSGIGERLFSASWLENLRRMMCGHEFVWRGETYRLDSTQHRRSRWASTITEQCSLCGEVRTCQPHEMHRPPVVLTTDDSEVDSAQRGANALRSHGYRTGDVDMVRLANEIERVIPRLDVRRVVKVEVVR